jgi:hypothetical protein
MMINADPCGFNQISVGAMFLMTLIARSVIG